MKVAIKRIKPMYVHLGMNFTALREIKYLKYIKGENIIDVSKLISLRPAMLSCGFHPFPPSACFLQMLDVFISDGVLHLVLEFCPFDMERVIRDKTILLQSHHVKSYMQMLLRLLQYRTRN